MKVLVTGFDPFGGAQINPSFEAVKKILLKDDSIELVKREIPTVFNRCIKILDQIIDEVQPQLVICTGQAGGRSDITVERLGINIIDARIEDNAGQKYIDEKIESHGADAYFSTLPIKSIVKNLRDEGIPASVSNTAGTFVCNNILYGLLHLAATKYPGLKGGFVHVPFLPEQVLDKRDTASMSLENMSEAMRIIIETAAHSDVDIKMESGTIC